MSAIQVFVDDANFATSGVSGQWDRQTSQSQAYDGTLSVGRITTGFSLPTSLTILFTGTDFFLYGIFNMGNAGTYSLDLGQTIPISFSTNTIGKPGVELWRLTGLTFDSHILEITPTAGDLTIDYFTYTPTSSTILTRNNLIVDDQHPAVSYSKGWASKSNEQYPEGAPYLGTTTGTSTVGSSMEFSFTGNLVAVYGALQQVPGTLSVSFSVDNAAPTIFTPWDGTQTSSSAWLVGSRMFRQPVPPGSHTLVVSLQAATGSQMLWLDSIVTGASLDTTLSNAVGGAGSKSTAGTTGAGPVSNTDTTGGGSKPSAGTPGTGSGSKTSPTGTVPTTNGHGPSNSVFGSTNVGTSTTSMVLTISANSPPNSGISGGTIAAIVGPVTSFVLLVAGILLRIWHKKWEAKQDEKRKAQEKAKGSSPQNNIQVEENIEMGHLGVN
ncbi:hypothetical protein D9619_008962 [Psilocybe cf. subviscida]|uniref:Uncharacterized protein n=1 Tax=Psilocybe cf. subviscida TaxID=2480587 RepID=A0A8H5BUD2_9AGAR|nr:hypothetical protein D9619_008962 [Psilocybe cf. subviscida]